MDILNSTDETATEFQTGRVKQRINTRSCRNKLTRLGAQKVFVSSPGLAESSEQIDFSSAGEASGKYQNELSRFSIRRQGSSFLPRSSLRALSGRVAHPPERLSRSLFFRPGRPTRPANCQRPAHPSRHNPRAPRSRVDMSRDDVLRVAPAAGGAHPQPSPSGQHRTVRQGGNVWHRLGADAAKSVSARRIGTAAIGRRVRNWQRSDTECRKRSRQE
jgi:hypothetical protein